MFYCCFVAFPAALTATATDLGAGNVCFTAVLWPFQPPKQPSSSPTRPWRAELQAKMRCNSAATQLSCITRFSTLLLHISPFGVAAELQLSCAYFSRNTLLFDALSCAELHPRGAGFCTAWLAKRKVPKEKRGAHALFTTSSARLDALSALSVISYMVVF